MKKLNSIYKKYEEIINYIVVGVMTTVVSLGTYYISVNTFLNPKNGIELQIANVISWIFAVTFAYFANRKFVFKSSNKNKFIEGFKFYLSRVSTLLIDMLSMFLLVTVMSINDKISKILVQFIVLVLNYIFSKFLVFKKNDSKIFWIWNCN